MAIPQEKFTSIKSEVIDLLSVLFESFNPDLDIDEQLKIHNKALDEYVNRVARIGMAAGVLGYKGLRDVCVTFQEYLRDLHRQYRILTAEERELLEEWPMLVMGYLSDTGSKSARDGLITHLKMIAYDQQLGEHDYLEIYQFLLDDSQQLEDEAETRMIMSGTPEPVIAVNPQVYESVPGKIAVSRSDLQVSADDASDDNEFALNADRQTLSELSREVWETVSELLTTVEEINKDNQSSGELAAALDLCADRLEIAGMSIANAGLMGVMDVVMFCQSGLRKLAESPNAAAMTGMSILHEWAKSLSAYLDDNANPDNSINLIIQTCELPGIDPLDDAEADTLLSLLLPKAFDVNGASGFQGPKMIADEENETADEGQNSITCETHEVQDSLKDGCQEPKEDAQSDVNEGCEVTDGSHNDIQATSLYFEDINKPPVALGESVLELVSLLRNEIEISREKLNATLAHAFGVEQGEPTFQALREFGEEVERFALAADSLGLQGLANVLGTLESNLQHIIEAGQVNARQASLLAEWPMHVVQYLQDVNDQKVVQELLRYLANPAWPLPVNQEVADELLEQLLSPDIDIEDGEVEPRQKKAGTEDVSLQLPEDVNQELLDSLLNELPGHTAEFSRIVTHLTEGDGSQQDVDVARRIAHTLKGAANTVGVNGIASLTHHIEDILQAFSKHDVLPGPAISDTLMQAADTLEVMSESLLGMGPPPDDAINVLQQVLDLANLIDEQGIPEDDAQAVSVSSNVPAHSQEASPQVARPEEQEEQLNGETILRVPARLIDELLRVVGESVILNGQLSEQLRMTLQQTRAAQEQNKLLQQLTFDLEQLVDVQGLTWEQQRRQVSNQFDMLEMDEYNELHTLTRRLVEAATDSQEFAHNIEEQLAHLDELVIEQGRLHKSNQETVMQTRMVPVKNIVPRLQRGVRQASRLTDKKVNLDVNGSETLMDSDVLNNLIDPLMHILRNAIDHGIEQEAIRLAKGKPREGKVKLSFLREGDQMLVRCEDDGAGLDYDSIRQTAIERGLVDDERNISEEELRRYILQQGFSTRTQATQISGRGIGMDAVYNRVINLKGSLAIDSQSDQGTRVELRLPLSFISVHGLLIRTHNRKIALSCRGVEQILHAGAGILQDNDDMLMYQLNDETYNAVHLEHLLHPKSEMQRTLHADCPVLLVREDSGELRAVLVEEVIASQDLVVKGLGKYLPAIDGIEGATILGDGSVATVIDMPDLLRADIRRLQLANGELEEELVLETQLPSALVVDDSLTSRRTLAEFIQDMGYEVHTARDGLEAIEIIENKRPDIVLADLEMPRMNGLELTNHIRAKTETRDIPIIMITSRSTEKHRQQAWEAGVNLYLTKPFSEDELMQHIEQLQVTPA